MFPPFGKIPAEFLPRPGIAEFAFFSLPLMIGVTPAVLVPAPAIVLRFELPHCLPAGPIKPVRNHGQAERGAAVLKKPNRSSFN